MSHNYQYIKPNKILYSTSQTLTEDPELPNKKIEMILYHHKTAKESRERN